MKILHCALSQFYVEGFNYQENIIPRMNKNDGNEVLIIASTESFKNNIEHGYVKPGTFINEDGIKVIRLKYKLKIPNFINRKFRAYKGLKKTIKEFNPDVILFHGAAAYDLLTVSKYVKKTKNVKLYVDSHEDSNNSATNFISKYLLHKIFYRCIISLSKKYITKFLAITYETKIFLNKMYNISDDLIEDYPLGGILVEKKDKAMYRNELLSKYNIPLDSFILMHSGKLDIRKQTIDIINAFNKVSDSRLILFIAGSMTKEVSNLIIPKIDQNKNIIYLKWLNSNELIKYIAASDLYIQPGGQSASMQNAICCGTPVAVKGHQSYRYLLGEKMLYIEDEKSIVDLLFKISNNEIDFEKLNMLSDEIAKEKLDYRKLAKRLYY